MRFLHTRSQLETCTKNLAIGNFEKLFKVQFLILQKTCQKHLSPINPFKPIDKSSIEEKNVLIGSGPKKPVQWQVVKFESEAKALYENRYK